MDTSETYIKMCEKAGEIQEQKPELYHDPYYLEASFNKPIYVVTTENYVYLTREDFITRQIWLPRQDQLQEMIGGFGWSGELAKLDRWIREIPFVQLRLLDTWEQLWLAFVMKEKYNKVWNGEDWE